MIGIKIENGRDPRCVADEEVELMQSIGWWLWHERIGRSRLFIVVIAVALMVTWAVFDWPSLVGALIL